MPLPYKLVESNKYSVGEKHNQWYLYTGLYQYRDNYYYCIFDKDNTEDVIISAIVDSKTINCFENTILDVLRRPQGIETIDDFLNRLKSSFYGSMFKYQ
jgi:hypothetical protein